ncbi:MAG TPA: excalibur calcium-binding domain-containing protein [Dehalococcoidia bacterium]|nr:excalibur calcium-binding domain-containing protein [Dehalococcoidia bacterium]
MKPLAALGIVVAVFVMMMPASTHVFAAKTCGDFESQAAAQAYLSDSPGDPDGLDPDHNGIACENLPCPCDTVPVDWFTAANPIATPAQTPSPEPAAGNTPATPSSSPAAATGSSGPKVVVVSQQVYNAVAAAISEGRDPVQVYDQLARIPDTPTITVPTLNGTNLITPPNTGDAGLASAR